MLGWAAALHAFENTLARLGYNATLLIPWRCELLTCW